MIKLSIELDQLIKKDKFIGSQQAYVDLDTTTLKKSFPSRNTIKAIKGTMGFSLPGVYHLGPKRCERFRADLEEMKGLKRFLNT